MVKKIYAALVILAMLMTMVAFPVSATEVSNYGNLYPATATENTPGWAGGTGATLVDDCPDGSGRQSLSFEHNASLASYGVVFSRRDFAGNAYAMERMQNYVHPIEYGKSYNLSFWLKLSDTDKLTTLCPTYYFWWDNNGYAGENWTNVDLKQTTDWQYVSMNFTVGATALNGVDQALKPAQFNFDFFAPYGMTLAEGETLSVCVDSLALREVPADGILETSYTGMNKILDGASCTGVEMTFSGTNLADGRLPESVKLNGSDFSDYTAVTEVSGNTTTVKFIFDEPVAAADVTAFEAEGFYDVWGREIEIDLSNVASAYSNLVPASATELNANWPSVGSGNTMEAVIFDGAEISSITANHTASLGADGVVFARRDNTGGYSMDCMQKGEIPFEYGKTYRFSTWVKTSSTKLKDLKLWWGLYYNGGNSYGTDSYSPIALKETTDWQYIALNFTVGALADGGSNPYELNLQLMTPSGLTLAEGEKFSITFHDFSICEVPGATELVTNFTSMNKITSGGLCNGIALNFDNIYVDGNKLPDSVKLNGEEVSAYTIEKSTFGNTSTLNIIFDEPMNASELLAFETTGICDIWGREIAVGVSDTAALYTNLIPEGATELNANWQVVGAGNTMETVTFEDEEISSITVNHNASLDANGVLFKRIDNRGGSSMQCMQNGKMPLEYGKTYNLSTWIKTSSTALDELMLWWGMYYNTDASGYAAESYPNNLISLKETTDWQYISTNFTVGVASLEGVDSVPYEFYIQLWTPNGMTLANGETFSATFHDFELCEVPAEGELTTGIESAKTLTDADGKAIGMELTFDGLYLDTENTSNFEVTVDGSAVDYEFDIVKDMISGTTVLTVSFEPVTVYDSVCVSGLYDIWGRTALDKIEHTYPADIAVNIQYYDGSKWVKLNEMSQIQGISNCQIKFSAEVKNNTDAPVALTLYGANYKSDVLEKAAINAGGTTVVSTKAVLSGTMTLDLVEAGETLKFFVWDSDGAPCCETIEIR